MGTRSRLASNLVSSRDMRRIFENTYKEYKKFK